jgi:GT2 family glycosyltransferase
VSGYFDELDELRGRVASLASELDAVRAQLAEKEDQIARIRRTLGWRLFGGGISPARAVPMSGGGQPLPAPGGGQAPAGIKEVIDFNDADAWLRWSEQVRCLPQRLSERMASFPSLPRVTVLLPAVGASEVLIERTLRSLASQVHAGWEALVFVSPGTRTELPAAAIEGVAHEPEDASSSDVPDLLVRLAAADARIVLVASDLPMSVCERLQSGLERAGGDVCLTLAAGDVLSPDALLEMAGAFGEGVVMVTFDDAGDEPRLRPEWSPELIVEWDYLGASRCFRIADARGAGGYRPGSEGAHELDLTLRLAARGEVRHVPLVLVHRRTTPPIARENARRAIAEHVERAGETATILDGATDDTFRVVRTLVEEPLLSVIITTRDRVDLLRDAVAAVEDSDYRNVEILIVDNGSTEPETVDWLRRSRHRVLRDDGPFNFAALNNRAAALARGEILLLLNNDVSMVTPNWLTELVRHAIRPQVGAVGPLLLYEDGSIQHGGVALGPGGVAGHHLKHMRRSEAGRWATVTRDVAAVTGACLMIRRALFEELGGLDEENLEVSYNDVDLCLRLRDRGYRIVFTPASVLTHLESRSRPHGVNAAQVEWMRARWQEALFHDPFHSPSYALDHRLFRSTMQPGFSKPAGTRAGVAHPAVAGRWLELEPGEPWRGELDAPRSHPTGIILQIVPPPSPLEIEVMIGDRAARVSSATATASGALAVLFASPVSVDAVALSIELTVSEPLRLRGAAPGLPAHRLLYG